MNLNEFKEKLFDKAKESGFEDSEIYVTNSESLSISIYKQEVEGLSKIMIGYEENISFSICWVYGVC